MVVVISYNKTSTAYMHSSVGIRLQASHHSEALLMDASVDSTALALAAMIPKYLHVSSGTEVAVPSVKGHEQIKQRRQTGRRSSDSHHNQA